MQEKYKQYFFVIRQLTAREIKRKYARSSLGVIWSILHPLLSMAVLSLIFSQLFRRSIENYPIYYLSGYILWQAFTSATSSALTTLADNRALFLKVKFPLELFILARVYTALIQLLYSFVAYATMLVVFHVTPKWAMFSIPLVLICLFTFSLGISYILATAYVHFGDIKHLYTVFLTLWMYCSGIFYPAEQLQGIIRTVLLLNPIYTFIHCLRNAVLDGIWPSGLQVTQMVLWGIGMYVLGHFIFKKNRNTLIQKL